MKQIYIFLILGSLLTSCEKDILCPADDFVGTYLGDTTCSLGINSEDGNEVKITKLDEKTIEIEIQKEILTVRIKDCELDVKDDIRLGTGVDGTASLNGTTLSVTYVKKAATIIVEECDFLGEKI